MITPCICGAIDHRRCEKYSTPMKKPFIHADPLLKDHICHLNDEQDCECFLAGVMAERNDMSNVMDFASSIKDDKEALKKWAKKEIAEYRKFIKILEKTT